MELMNLSCEAFLEDLAGSAPAPGGGGAAALVGAAGAALGNMVGSLTIGKKKYAAVEADILVLNRRAAALRKRLEGLVQADADAFAPLAAAYKLPKETPEQQAHKAAVLEAALEGACAVPLEIMSACCEGIALAAEYAEKGMRPRRPLPWVWRSASTTVPVGAPSRASCIPRVLVESVSS